MYRSHGVEGSFATRLSATADDQSSRSVSSPSLHLSLFGRRSVSLPPRDSSSASARILRGGRRGFERSRARRRVRVFALRRFSLLRRQAPPLASQFPPEFVVPPLIRGGDGGLHAFERLFEMRGCDERRRRRRSRLRRRLRPRLPASRRDPRAFPRLVVRRRRGEVPLERRHARLAHKTGQIRTAEPAAPSALSHARDVKPRREGCLSRERPENRRASVRRR